MARTRCIDCVFTAGSRAAADERAALDARICVLAGIPFRCSHPHGLDKTPENIAEYHRLEAANAFPICHGWREETGKLVAAGHFRRMRGFIRGLGHSAHEAVAILGVPWISQSERREAKATFNRCIELLTSKRDATVRLLVDPKDVGR